MNNNMIKNVTHISLIELLSSNSNNNFYYSIPLYQRDYSWKKENISEFITDIFEAYQDYIKNNNTNYFFGSVITVMDNEDNNKYNLIDGQQRLTTFILFLKILENDFNETCFKEINKASEVEKDDLSQLRLWIRDCLWVKKDKELCKLTSEKSNDTIIITKILSGEDIKKTESRLCDNYDILLKLYNDLKNDYEDNFKLIKFINFILKNIEFVKVETTSRDSALKIFSILNTRGLELTSTDIIKAEAMNDIDVNKHKYFESKWRELENKSKEYKITLETLFRYYITMYKPDSIKGTNNENIKEIWKNRNKLEAIEEFEEFVSCYEYILKIKNSYIWCLRHLLIMGKNSYTWIPALVSMKFYGYSENDIIDVAKFLVKWHWIHLINGYTIEKIKSFNFSIIKAIKNHNTKIEVCNLQPRIITHDRQDLNLLCKNLCENLRNYDLYNQKWAKAFIYFIHNTTLLTITKDMFDIEFTAKLTFEHIYPQNPKEDEWIKCSDENKHKLGNLTLLPSRDNIIASNDINKKISIYKSKLFMYTPELSEDDPWTDEKIASRTNELLKDFCKYIDINYYN
ncbi:DUF262 domain-containing HNH endonuclease family protein [Brachyspira intermedia]|uniref:DUF262 domain-containing protein n=1 Tax=Brachyspira intermedia TaxID=84377 RepID=UPI0030077AE4